MTRILRRLSRVGLQKGLRSGSRLWLAAGALAWVLAHLRRAEARVVFREELRPGQQVMIDHLTETEGQARRRRRHPGSA